MKRTQYDSLKSHEAFMKEAKKYKPLAIKEEQLLAAMCQEGSRAAMDKLVRHNIMFAVKTAHSYCMGSTRAEDLISEAILGMYRAAEKFKPTEGKFISYAVWWIRAAINREIFKRGGAVHTPAQSAQGLKYLKLYEATRGDPLMADNDEIRRKLKLSKKTNAATDAALDGARVVYAGHLSLNHPITYHTSDGVEHQDRLVSDGRLPDECIDEIARHGAIEEAMEYLDEREVTIIERMFFNEPNESLDTVGDSMGLSRERIRQIKNGALDKMRRKHGKALACSLGRAYDGE